MFLWVYMRGGSGPPSDGALLPYVFLTGGAFVATFIPVLGLTFHSMAMALIGAFLAFGALGFSVRWLWSSSSALLGLVGSLPAFLFACSFHNWSLPAVLSKPVHGLPLILLPVMSFVGVLCGAFGGRLLRRRTRESSRPAPTSTLDK